MKALAFKKIIREEVRKALREADLNPNDIYVVDMIGSRGEFETDPMEKVSGDLQKIAKAVVKKATDDADYPEYAEEFIRAYKLDEDTYYVLTGEETVTIVGRPKSKKYGSFWSMLASDDTEGAAEIFDMMDEDAANAQELTETNKTINEATFALPNDFIMYRASGMTPEEGGYGEYNYGVAYFHSDRGRLNMTDVAKNASAAFKMAKQVAQAIQGDRAEGMASLGGDDVKNIKIHAMKTDSGERGIGFTAYVYSKMSPAQVKKAIKGPGVKSLS